MIENTNHVRVPIAPPLIFLGYLIAALLLNWALPLSVPWLGLLRAVGGLMVLAGLFLGVTAIRLMLRTHTSPDLHRPTTALVTEGLYARSRNPIYLGLLVIYLGFTLLAGTLWGILLSPLVLLTVDRAVIRVEEAYLQDKFDARYSEYKFRVRQWL
jgi:protein-S-isoprenylcysteine O-methyltransferase Ste14